MATTILFIKSEFFYKCFCERLLLPFFFQFGFKWIYTFSWELRRTCLTSWKIFVFCRNHCKVRNKKWTKKLNSLCSDAITSLTLQTLSNKYITILYNMIKHSISFWLANSTHAFTYTVLTVFVKEPCGD